MPAATTFLKVTNRASGALDGAIGVGDPIAVVLHAGEGALFPAVYPFHITIDAEILECTLRVADTLTCTRAAEGTANAGHANDAPVQLRVTAQIVTELQTAVNNCETVGAFTNEAEGITAKWTWTLAAGIHIARRIGADIADRSYWSDDRIAWGTGGAGADTEIGRGGANLLTTPDDIQFGAGPASAGVIRLSNATYIYARNAAGAANYLVIGLNAADQIAMQAPIKHELAAGTVAFSAYVLGAGNPKTTIEHGQIQFGPGGAGALDVNLYRNGANILRSDDAFRDDAGFFVNIAPTLTDGIRVYKSFAAVAGIVSGAWLEVVNNAGGASAAAVIGVRAIVTIQGANPPSNYAYGGLYACVHDAAAALARGIGARFDVEINNAASITEGRGIEVKFNRSAGAGEIITARGIYINNPTGGLAPTTLVGIYLQNLVAGVTNISIQSLGGHMRHVGAATFGADATPAVGSIIDLQTTTGAFLLSRLTTAQIAALPGVADGMILYNASLPGIQARVNAAWITLGVGNTPGSSMAAPHLFDDFIGGNNSSGQIGELQWIVAASAGTTIAAQTGVAGHPGILRIVVPATSGYYAAMYLSQSIAPIIPADYFDITFVFRVPTIATATACYRVGLSFSPTLDPPTDGLYLEKKTGDANWFFCSRSAGADRTRTDTGIAVDTSWRKIRIWRTSAADISFKLDAGGVTIHNVSIPTNPLTPMAFAKTNAVASAYIEADAFDMYITGLAR